jgi:SAM-dependent methyltransferase
MDVFHMPFAEGWFDKAYCFGVLQHTPDPREAFHAIVRHLKPGGRIASDIYVKDILNAIKSKKLKFIILIHQKIIRKIMQFQYVSTAMRKLVVIILFIQKEENLLRLN